MTSIDAIDADNDDEMRRYEVLRALLQIFAG